MFDSLVLADLPPEAEALRGTVKALVQETLATLTLEQRARSWAGFDATFSRAMAAAGLIGLTLPREYGGQGRGPFARFVVVEELLTVGAPVAAHWIADRQSAPLLLRYGSETQRRYYLPRICRGEIYFCIGMSEPGAGSDLASVRTRAVATESGWRLSGQKVWTTYAHRDDFMIALVRTSEHNIPAALSVAGNAQVHRCVQNALQFQLSIPVLPLAFKQRGGFIIRLAKSLVDRHLHLRPLDHDKVPRLREPYRWRVMRGDNQPRQNVFRYWRRLKLTAYIAPAEQCFVKTLHRLLALAG